MWEVEDESGAYGHYSEQLIVFASPQNDKPAPTSLKAGKSSNANPLEYVGASG